MIKCVDVIKHYKGDVHALKGLTLDIEKGEFVFVVGPSGSGKSTFLKLLTKEEEPSSGEIYVAGKNLATLPRWRVPYLRRNVGDLFSDPATGTATFSLQLVLVPDPQQFTIAIEPARTGSGVLIMRWDTTQATIPIRVDK